jgi:hypothetical protein
MDRRLLERERRCPEHDLALGPDGACVVCRRARGDVAPPWLGRVLSAAGIGVVVLGALALRRPHPAPPPTVSVALAPPPTLPTEAEEEAPQRSSPHAPFARDAFARPSPGNGAPPLPTRSGEAAQPAAPTAAGDAGAVGAVDDADEPPDEPAPAPDQAAQHDESAGSAVAAFGRTRGGGAPMDVATPSGGDDAHVRAGARSSSGGASAPANRTRPRFVKR